MGISSFIFRTTVYAITLAALETGVDVFKSQQELKIDRSSSFLAAEIILLMFLLRFCGVFRRNYTQEISELV